MKPLRIVFSAAIIFALHLALVAYINSSMVSQYVSTNTVGLLYATGSCLSLVVLFVIPRVLRRHGLVRTATVLFSTSATMLLIIGTAREAIIALPSFVLYLSLNASIAYCFDIFLEHYAQAKSVGALRGSYLSITNTAWVIAPVTTSALLAIGGFRLIYCIAAGLVTSVLLIVSRQLQGFVDKPYEMIVGKNILPFNELIASIPLRRVATINFILQLFYAWMVIYSPLYLTRVIGLSWGQVGIAFSCMLVAFVIVQYPAGKLADRFGQKRFILIALAICASATTLFALLPQHATVIQVALILFLSRVGAALLEVMTDTYFFTHVKETQTQAVSAYRMIIPLSFIIGATTGGTFIALFGYSGLFGILAGLLVTALWYSFRLPE